MQRSLMKQNVKLLIELNLIFNLFRMDTNKKEDLEEVEKRLMAKVDLTSLDNIFKDFGVDDMLEKLALQMRGIAENVANAEENARKIYEEYQVAFDATMKTHEHYFRANGIIIPADTQEYFSWIAFAFPDEEYPFLITAASDSYHFKLYHDYKERLFIRQGWNKKKEYEYLQENVFNQAKRLQNPLSIKQIALKYVYEGLQITRENGDAIAKEYGHTSGEALFQRYTRYLSSANRRGQEDTRRKQQNKIDLIESIIPLLTDSAQKKALDEVSILKKVAETEYL